MSIPDTDETHPSGPVKDPINTEEAKESGEVSTAHDVIVYIAHATNAENEGRTYTPISEGKSVKSVEGILTSAVDSFIGSHTASHNTEPNVKTTKKREFSHTIKSRVQLFPPPRVE